MHSVADIVAIVTDPYRYPSPVLAVGSDHCTTSCGVADDGTVIIRRPMHRILHIGATRSRSRPAVTTSTSTRSCANACRQFHVNVELANLTMGSACCGGTKDARPDARGHRSPAHSLGVPPAAAAREQQYTVGRSVGPR